MSFKISKTLNSDIVNTAIINTDTLNAQIINKPYIILNSQPVYPLNLYGINTVFKTVNIPLIITNIKGCTDGQVVTFYNCFKPTNTPVLFAEQTPIKFVKSETLKTFDGGDTYDLLINHSISGIWSDTLGHMQLVNTV